MKLREILIDIHALEEELLAFERKYGVRSETFYPAYMSGEEPEDDGWVLDFGEWASVYSTWLSRQAEYRNESCTLWPPIQRFISRMRWLLLGGWRSCGLWRRNRKRLMDSGRIWRHASG